MRLSIKANLAATFLFLAMLCGGRGTFAMSDVSRMAANLLSLGNALLLVIVAIDRLPGTTSKVRIKQYLVMLQPGNPRDISCQGQMTP